MRLPLLAALACVGSAAAQHAPIETYRQVPGSMEFSDRLIVRPAQPDDLAARGLSNAEIETTRERARDLLRTLDQLNHEPLVDHYVIALPEGHTENTLAAQLLATGLFEFAEPDWILYPADCPDDRYLPLQWHHADNMMQSCLAWEIHTGTPDVTIAICDTGIETTHPDFQLHRKEGYNAADRLWESEGGRIDPVNDHGTHVSGCAAANGNNQGQGVAGVGWNFSHRMMRVSNLSSGGAYLSDLTHAALTAIEQGDNVANVSYSGVNSASVRTTASAIKDLGGLLTWAAGNNSAYLDWGDRDQDDVIVVGNSNSSDVKYETSAYGPSVDFFAPGTAVYATLLDGTYGTKTGTSMAAPIAAGLIALVWSADPTRTPDEVESIIKLSADQLGDDDDYGYGRVNAYQALLLALGEPCDADFDGDADADTQDVLAFLNAWAAGNPDADTDDNGLIDSRDLVTFLNLWSAGC